MRRCSVCIHPERAAIDASQAPNRRIAARYGLSEAAVRRHKAHLSAPKAPTDAPRALARVEAARLQALALLDDVLRSDGFGVLSAAEKARQVLEGQGVEIERVASPTADALEWIEVATPFERRALSRIEARCRERSEHAQKMHRL